MEIRITDMVRVNELKDCKAVVKWLKAEKYRVSEMIRISMSKYPGAFSAIKTEITVYGKREICMYIMCHAKDSIVELYSTIHIDIDEFEYTVEDRVITTVYVKQ